MGSLVIHVISDSLGETAERIVTAAISHFDDVEYKIVKHSDVTEIDDINEIIHRAKLSRGIIFYVAILDEVKNAILEGCTVNEVRCIDGLYPVISTFSNYLNILPTKQTTLFCKEEHDYFKKVDALEFAIKYDDAKDISGIYSADVVILGVSRTSKTPLCMLLALKKVKALNIPLIPEIGLPEELYDIPRSKIIGLTNSAEHLSEIRKTRVRELGLKEDSLYGDSSKIEQELEFSSKIMEGLGCPVIDVSGRAVEEIVNEVCEILKIRC